MRADVRVEAVVARRSIRSTRRARARDERGGELALRAPPGVNTLRPWSGSECTSSTRAGANAAADRVDRGAIASPR